MTARLSLAAGILSLLAAPVGAQPLPSWNGSKTGVYDPSGNQIGNQNPMSVVTTPNTVNLLNTTVTCASTSTPFGVSGAVYLRVQVPPGAQNVGFAWGAGATATMSPPSEVYPGYTTLDWAGGTGACIVSGGTQIIAVMYR